MSSLLTSVGSVITFVFAQLSTFLGMFVTEPVLQLFLGLAVAGGIIGLVEALIWRGTSKAE